MKEIVIFVLLVLFPCVAAADAARQGYTEVALAAATLERKAVIADRIELSEEESREFWPIYNEYLIRHEKLRMGTTASVVVLTGTAGSEADGGTPALPRALQ